MKRYCGDDRPSNVYWAVGPVQGHLVVRGQVNINVEVRANEWRKVFGHKGSGRWFEDKCFLGLTEQRLEGLTCPQEQHSGWF